MARKFLAAAAAVLALGSASVSAATFTMSLSGPGFTTLDTDCGPGLRDCMPAVGWFGGLTVETDGVADGTYWGADVPLVELDTNLYSFRVFPAIDADIDCCDLFLVTLAHGIPVDLEIHYMPSPFESFDVRGMHASFTIERNGRDGAFPFSGGSATVFEVPEPAMAGLLLAGLAIVATGFKLRGAFPGSGRRQARPSA